MDFVSQTKLDVSYLNKDLTVKSASIRLLSEDIFPKLYLTFEDIYELKNKLYIDPTCSDELKQILQNKNLELNKKEKRMVTELGRQDHHDPNFVKNLAKMIDNKITDEEDRNRLNSIFAIDGIHGYALEDYIENLKYTHKSVYIKSPDLLHVTAIRKLYDVKKELITQYSPQEVFEIMTKIYENTLSDTDVKLYLACAQNKLNEVKPVIQRKMDERIKKLKMLMQPDDTRSKDHLIDLNVETN